MRSLQRDLRATSSSYRDLVDAARHRRAEKLLAEPSLSVTEVAFRLGYGQVSSFNRAAQRWTNKSPSQMRAHLLARRTPSAE